MKDIEDYFIAATARAVSNYVSDNAQSRVTEFNFSKNSVIKYTNSPFMPKHLLDGKYIDEVIKLGGGEVDNDDFAGTWYSINHVGLFCENLELSIRERRIGDRGFKYGDYWLISAIERILESDIFEQTHNNDTTKDGNLDIWEPIEINVTDEISAAIENAEEALEAIRSDNGYAATKPVERAEVVFALEAGIRQLREHAAISRAYFDSFIWQPLSRAAHTFGKGVVGIAIKAAQESLKAAFRRFFDGFWNQ